MQSIFLAKDKNALVFDKLRALRELIEGADFESFGIFVENVRNE